MKYIEAIAYLHSLTDYEKTRIKRYTPETLNLSRVKSMLDALGNPHHQFSAVHIAGTKGKGSTAAMIEASLQAAGYRTGLYTSPHLHTFRERIQVAGHKISQEDVISLVEEIRPLIERMTGVTTFEAITAMGFLTFARSDVDIAVVEVGLGGRLDATNVLTPEVSVITSISLDHTYLLGNTLGEIAREKAGIIKPDIPTVSAPQRAEAINVIKTVSEEQGAPLTEVGRDWDYEPGPPGWDGQHVTVQRINGDEADLSGEYWISLLGRHQLENATSAIAVLDILRRRGFHIPVEAVHEGLGQVYWPGRLEILSQDPLVVVDCAHNPYSARTLRQTLTEWFPDQSWVLIYGASADKDIGGMLEALLPISDYTIVTRAEHPRATAPVTLADIAAQEGGGAEIGVDVRKSLQRALAMMEPDNGLLATGSIFLVASVREEWARHIGAPLPDRDGDDD